MTREEEKKLARELWEHRDDPDEWDDEPEDFVVGPNPRAVLSVPFTTQELGEVEQAAEREGTDIFEFIRKSALERSRSSPTKVRKARAS